MFEIVSSRLKIYEGAVLVGMLRSHGLAAQMWYQHTAALECELTFGGVSVMVPTEEIEEALQLIMMPVDLTDEWMADESDSPEIYATKYPDLVSLLLFFVKWSLAIGFLINFTPSVLTSIADVRSGILSKAELASVLGDALLQLADAAGIGVIIALLGAIAFTLFSLMDRSRNVRTIIAAFFVIGYYSPLLIVVFFELYLRWLVRF